LPIEPPESTDAWSRAVEEGKAAQALASDIVSAAGFEIIQRDRRIPGVGIQVGVVARDADGGQWYFDVTGAFSANRSGLSRADTLWKALGRVGVLKACGIRPIVLLSTDLPPRRSSGDKALRSVGPDAVADVMDMIDSTDRDRLAAYATGGCRQRPLPGFWSTSELAARS
jgi:hypothetical protein